jgi:hypothetical protein
MTPELVAQVMALVFVAQGRQPPEGTGKVWLYIFEDLADGTDVLDVTRRVIRSAEYVTAGDIHRAIVAERKRQAALRALPVASGGDGVPLACRKCGGTGFMDIDWRDAPGGKPGHHCVARCQCELTPVRYASKETTAFWQAKCRQQFENARGPLAAGLRRTVTVPRADERYFADEPDRPELLEVERWHWGDDPPEQPEEEA